MPADVHQVIASIPDWQGRRARFAPLSGGLTNTNFRVDVDDAVFVLRIPGESTELLAIDRRNELHNTQAAAEIGIGPRVVCHVAEHDAMVIEFIAGPTMTIADLRRPEMLPRVAESLRRLHAGPRFQADFDMLSLARQYLGTLEGLAAPLPEGLAAWLPEIEQVERALRARQSPTVPCHNDLLAGNFIDDGRTLRIVDYEYSGNNDPCFELGNACQEQEYDDEQIATLCAAYFGRHDPVLVARVKLNMIVSDFGWSLWAAIQTKISRIDFDFWEYGAQRWRRAAEKLSSPAYRAWLRVAAE